MEKTVAVIRGDGIGPEIVEQALPVLAQMPFISSMSTRLSPSMALMQKEQVPGRRWVGWPVRMVWGSLSTPSMSLRDRPPT